MTARLRTRLLGGRFGVEVTGCGDLADLDPPDVATLRGLLLAHKVVGLRGAALTASGHRRLLGLLGAPTTPVAAGPRPRPEGTPSLGRWVSAGSHLLAPPRLLSLRAAGPDVAGEVTRLADVTGAYRDLPLPLRDLADRSWAVHGLQPEDVAGAGELVVHPVARLHTETGDRGLLLGGHAQRLVGLSGEESRTVVHLLQSYLVRPHNVLTWHWQDGDVLLVDARAVQHHERPCPGPVPPATATLHVAGDRPLGVDGRHSHPLCAGPADARRTA